jgi:hypothetical protein
MGGKVRFWGEVEDGGEVEEGDLDVGWRGESRWWRGLDLEFDSSSMMNFSLHPHWHCPSRMELFH